MQAQPPKPHEMKKVVLSQRIMYNNGVAYDCTEHNWYGFFNNHNLIFLPNSQKIECGLLADHADVFIITGGDDSNLRRSIELKMATEMMMRKKPVIGICHGAFLITDILGGAVTPVTGHSNTDHALYYKDRIIKVNSFHDQAITRLHSKGQVLCVDDSGNIESFIDDKLAGIVWHPERMPDPFIPDEIQNLYLDIM